MRLRQRFSLRRFLRGLGPVAGPHLTRAGNVYILPTRQGLGFLLVLTLMLIGAINYVNSLAFAFTFLLGSVAVTGIVHTWRNLLGLRIRVRSPEPVFAGSAVRLPVVIDNPDAPRAALEITIGRRATPRRLVAEPGQTVVQVDLPPSPRGRHPLPALQVSTRFPLGLFRAWTIVHPAGDFLIWPRPAASAPAPPSGGDAHARGGEQGQGREDFASLRDYRHGDSLHHVHWKAAARQQGLLVKEFQGETSESVILDWDSLPPADVETRLSVLCRQILAAEAADQRYALRLPDRTLPAGRGGEHRRRCLDALARWGTA